MPDENQDTVEDPQVDSVDNSFAAAVGTGFLADSITRNAAQIKRDRGEAIGEDIAMSYKHKIDNLMKDLRKMKRRQKDMFDFSPRSSFSLVLAEDVNGEDVVDKDLELAVDIWKLEQRIARAKERYKFLVGAPYTPTIPGGA